MKKMNDESSDTDQKIWLQGVIICLLICATYSISYTFGFINYGDPIYVSENANVATGLSKSNVIWAFTTTEGTNLWHPLTLISFLTESSIFGAEAPEVRHLINVVLHLFSALILWRILHKLLPHPWVALIITLFWALHPQRIQSVIWISERKDVLTGFLAMLSFWAWIQAEHKAKALFYTLSLVSFGAALLSKPGVAPFPLALFFYQFFIVKKGKDLTHIIQTVKKLSPYLLASSIVSLVAILVRKSGEISETFPFLQRISLIPFNIGFYVKNLFIPFPGTLWVSPPGDETSTTIIVISWFILIGVLSLAFWFTRHNKLSLFGLIWFILFWMPVSGVFPVSFYYVADSHSYLPHIGLLLFISGFISKIPALNTKKTIITGAILSLALMAITIPRLLAWKSSETLFKKELATNPQSILAPTQLAKMYLKNGQVEEATKFFRLSTQQDSHSSRPWLTLGETYEDLGEKELALEAYVKACYLSPKYIKSFLRAAALYTEQKNYQDADDILSLGLHYKPEEVLFWVNKGKLNFEDIKNPQEATSCYVKAVEVAPKNPDALLGLALIHIQYGASAKARSLLEDAHKYAPERKDVKMTLDILKGP